jgi:hypothetical protein
VADLFGKVKKDGFEINMPNPAIYPLVITPVAREPRLDHHAFAVE